ncbi:hypothetical protein SteCoe_37004 [Stentor coeruleus]|uniref:Uncharacterized protein n=1 Tax=Stentor coeruleus TaxID=5963 RepID=A0A1R2ANX0_9CILI|nr:hypothetical protein SteCoe_37004 [Stentor coeruleus]
MAFNYYGSTSHSKFLEKSNCIKCFIYRDCPNYCQSHRYCTKCFKFNPEYIVKCYMCEVTLKSACKKCFKITEEDKRYAIPSCKFHHMYCLECLKNPKYLNQTDFCWECLKFYSYQTELYCCFCQSSNDRCKHLCEKHFICHKCDENYITSTLLPIYSELLECKNCKSMLINYLHPQLLEIAKTNFQNAPQTYNAKKYSEERYTRDQDINKNHSLTYANTFSNPETNLSRMNNPISAENNLGSYWQTRNNYEASKQNSSSGYQILIQQKQIAYEMCKLCEENHILMECTHVMCLKKINERFIIKFKYFIENLYYNNVDWLNSQLFSIDCPEDCCYNSMILPFSSVSESVKRFSNKNLIASELCDYYSLIFEGVIYKFIQCETCEKTTGSIFGNYCMFCNKTIS